MSDPLSQLTRLQVMDEELEKLRRQGLDKEASLDQTESKTEELESLVKGRSDEFTRIQKVRRSLESEAADFVERIAKLKGKTLEVKTNREYSALLEETKNLESQKDDSETKILEHMEEEEKLGRMRTEAQGAFEEGKKRLDEMTLEVRQQQAALEKELQEKDKVRQEFAGSITSKVLQKYDKIRAIRDGVALSCIEGTLCSQCSVNLPPQLIIEVRKNIDLVLCPSCSRILYQVVKETAHPA